MKIRPPAARYGRQGAVACLVGVVVGFGAIGLVVPIEFNDVASGSFDVNPSTC